jgi:ribosomal protein S13
MMQDENIILLLKNSLLKFPKKIKPIFHFNNIYGLGFFRIRFLLIFLGLNKNFNFLINYLINNNFNLRLQLLLLKNYWLLGSLLKKRRLLYYKFEKKLKNYIFYRKKYNLPCRGQRTHSNRQTMKNFFKFNFVGLIKKDLLFNKKKFSRKNIKNQKKTNRKKK